MTLVEHNLEMYKGDTKFLVDTVYNTDGSLKDLTDASIVWVLYDANTKEILASKTTPSDIQILDAKGGVLQINISWEDTEHLKSGPWYRYEIKVLDAASNISTVNTGAFTLWESVV
jgi:hypothetical protein